MALLMCAPLCAAESSQVRPWDGARQLVRVITPDWNSNHAILQAFERTRVGWRAVSGEVPVVIGRTGTAWGIGLHPPQPGALKQEGDARSPAGVFGIGRAFGYASSLSTGLRYTAMGIDDYCIDVTGSPVYNRIVNAHDLGRAAVQGSTEPMRRDLHANGDQRYKLGFLIEHNTHGLAGAGGCIFAHLRERADSSTLGCTAMAEPAMKWLLSWLRAEDHPIFVLLPQREYRRLTASWHLPELRAP